ncbi:Amino acid transporter [Friedmanniella luteola]|uniref:Amino acid transporter n=1 Tax=Friedmanniella luteola TaxID=546871 RepID=A0A1H1XYZ5_9ACTN|nr:Amino acid transporter [Friedmanniella luteola]
MTTTAPPAARTTTAATPPTPRGPVRAWLLEGLADRHRGHPGPHAHPADTERKHSWWRVMCLTGVDYFSTLGYQPGIAALAAGAVSPLATLVLVALTLLGALPVYRRVAEESPHGEGSIAMLERLLSFWGGKLFVLVLLGFAATDFLITMTLSAADASAHLVENPHLSALLEGHEVPVTLVLLALLGGVFLKGFKEAIGIAVGLVAVYLALNVVVIGVGLYHVVTQPSLVTDWQTALTTSHASPLVVVAVALLVFPKLALGLSGFETGVAVMPHIQGAPGDDEEHPRGRVAGAKRLLTAAALTMSVFLVSSSFVTTLLIPAAEFQPGGGANGRALAYLAHDYLGGVVGSVYDASTIAILWFAGASAMAGLLNLIPRYLPRYGMAPHWARAVRPLVLILTAAAFAITVIFDADVDAQGGAYATGVLVLITSAAIAVTLAARRARQRKRTVAFAVIALVFLYTTAANVVERPDGVRIAAVFIAAIVAVSLVSRLSRSFELRVDAVVLDAPAQRFVRDCARRTIRLVPHEPDRRDRAEYSEKLRQVSRDNDLGSADDVVFVEITVADASDFESTLEVHGEVRHGRYRVLTATSSTVPNALAALLLEIRDQTGRSPHVYFEWTEGNPLVNLARFLLLGNGEIAPVTREVLRQAERDRSRRPHVHVG